MFLFYGKAVIMIILRVKFQELLVKDALYENLNKKKM